MHVCSLALANKLHETDLKAISTNPTALEDIISEDIIFPIAGASTETSLVCAFAAANDGGTSAWNAGVSTSSTSTSGAYETKEGDLDISCVGFRRNKAGNRFICFGIVSLLDGGSVVVVVL